MPGLPRRGERWLLTTLAGHLPEGAEEHDMSSEEKDVSSKIIQLRNRVLRNSPLLDAEGRLKEVLRQFRVAVKNIERIGSDGIIALEDILVLADELLREARDYYASSRKFHEILSEVLICLEGDNCSYEICAKLRRKRDEIMRRDYYSPEDRLGEVLRQFRVLVRKIENEGDNSQESVNDITEVSELLLALASSYYNGGYEGLYPIVIEVEHFLTKLLNR